MSHFLCVVLTKPDAEHPFNDDSAEKMVGVLMEPYSENRELPEYETDCWCVGREAGARADQVAEERCGTWDALRAAHADKVASLVHSGQMDPNDHEAAQKLWEAEFWGPRDVLRRATLEADPEKTTPAADCEDCKGTGKVTTTRNPEGHWDWFQVGGRWSGFFDKTYDPDKDPANTETCMHCHGSGVRRDSIPLEWNLQGILQKHVKEASLDATLLESIQRTLLPKTDSPFERVKLADVKAFTEGLLSGKVSEGLHVDRVTLLRTLTDEMERFSRDGSPCNACQGKGTAVKWPTNWRPVGGNYARTEDLVAGAEKGEDYIPYALVTPDGTWHARGKMGWFGTSSDEQDRERWKEFVLEQYREHPNHLAVVVDCHT